MSFFRFEVGADWYAYDAMYQTARSTPFEGALSISDPLFSFLLWISAQLGWGIYFPNAVCSLVLVIGVIMLAVQLRQPWLAILAAVPYLLIVVGFGYIRQAAAIGFILMALASVGKGAMFRSVILLALAGGFHSTAAGVSRSLRWPSPIATSFACSSSLRSVPPDWYLPFATAGALRDHVHRQ